MATLPLPERDLWEGLRKACMKLSDDEGVSVLLQQYDSIQSIDAGGIVSI